MSNDAFEKKVLDPLFQIVEYLTSSDFEFPFKNDSVLEEKEKDLLELRATVKNLMFRFDDSRRENEQKDLEIEDLKKKLVELQNSSNLLGRDDSFRELEHISSDDDQEDELKNEVVKAEEEKIDSDLDTSSGIKLLLKNRDWDIPEGLLENENFSLKEIQRSKFQKWMIVKKFKLFMLLLACLMFDDDYENVSKYLYFDENFKDDDLLNSASKEWRGNLIFYDKFTEIADLLDEIPAKNRYELLIARFEEILETT